MLTGDPEKLTNAQDYFRMLDPNDLGEAVSNTYLVRG